MPDRPEGSSAEGGAAPSGPPRRSLAAGTVATIAGIAIAAAVLTRRQLVYAGALFAVGLALAAIASLLWRRKRRIETTIGVVILLALGAGVVWYFTQPAGKSPKAVASHPTSRGPSTPLMPPVTPSTTQQATIAEYPIPTPNADPGSITLGPDGALWFVEQDTDKIGRITADGGRITEYALPHGSGPAVIVDGPDGNLWLLENAGGGYGSVPQKIAKVTPQGQVTPFPVPAHSNVVGIATGPDGNIWFTQFGLNEIGRMNTSGKITGEFPIPTPSSGAAYITPGPNGNLWFDEQNGHQIAQVTLTGTITEYRYTAPPVAGTQNNHNPAPGPDGNVWFTDFWNNKIGYVTPAGQVTEYPGSTPGGLILGIVTGADGNLWFTECVPDPSRNFCSSGSKIGRCTPQGHITEYPLSDPTSGPGGITAGPNNTIWFTEGQSNMIGKLVIPTSPG